jgi:hypothetical protein
MRSRLPSIVLGLLLTQACSCATTSTPTPAPVPAGTPAEAPAPTPAPTADDATGPDTWADTAVDVVREGAPAQIAAVRIGTHEGFDRVVFELGGDQVPGYHLAYLDGPAVQCASGAPIAVKGSARLSIRLQPALAHDASGAPVVPAETTSALPVIQEVARSCDVEADASWVVGVSARKPFRVFELASPARLVVDVQD